jgi:hypothetical protein
LFGDFNMARYFSCAGVAASTDASTWSCPFEAESIKPRYALYRFSFLVPSFSAIFSECLTPAQN